MLVSLQNAAGLEAFQRGQQSMNTDMSHARPSNSTIKEFGDSLFRMLLLVIISSFPSLQTEFHSPKDALLITASLSSLFGPSVSHIVHEVALSSREQVLMIG